MNKPNVNDKTLISHRDYYQCHGYVVLPNFLSHEEITELRHCVDAVYPQWRAANSENIYQHRLVNMHSLTHVDYFAENRDQRIRFFNAIANERLLASLHSIFGTGLYFHNTQLFFNPTNAERKPYWHRDLQYSPVADDEQRQVQTEMVSLHVRIPLLAENSIELVPGSHLRWDTDLERQVRFDLDDHHHHEDLPGSKQIALGVGDVLIFNAQMLHRGQYHRDEERMALDLCTGKAHRLTQCYLAPAVLPSATELATLAKTGFYANAHQLLETIKKEKR